MMFECEAYSEIRSQNMFVTLFVSGISNVITLFCSAQQQPLLADFIRAVSLKRTGCQSYYHLNACFGCRICFSSFSRFSTMLRETFWP